MWGTLWAPSTTTKIPNSWAKAHISLIGLTSPITLLTIASEIILVLGVTAFFTLSKVTWKLSSKSINFTTAPFSFSSLNQGSTFEACSEVVINISSPSSIKGEKKPEAIIFKLSVVPDVKIISSLYLAFIKFFTKSRDFSYSISTLNDIS